MHVAFGRVRRRIALLRTSFSLMRNVYSEMVLARGFIFSVHDFKVVAEIKVVHFGSLVHLSSAVH